MARCKVPPIRVSVTFAPRADPTATDQVVAVLPDILQRHPMPCDYNPKQHVSTTGGDKP